MSHFRNRVSDYLERNRRNISIAWYFEMIGIVMGNWVARIPDVKLEHNLSDWLFGVLLLCSIFGGMLSFPIVGSVVDRYGSKVGILVGSASIIILTPIIGFPYKSVYILAIGLAGLGFGWGILEVTANTQASLLEKTTNQHWLGYFQANFSIGCLIGALFGGMMANFNVSPFYNFLIMNAIILPTVYIFQFGLFSQQEEIQSNDSFKAQYGAIQSSHRSNHNNGNVISNSHNQRDMHLSNNSLSDDDIADNGSSNTIVEMNASHNTKANTSTSIAQAQHHDIEASSSVDNHDPTSTAQSSSSSWTALAELYPLCGIAIIAAMAEGSVSDWSTIFMSINLDMSAVVSAAGFALFSLMVALGRLASDHLRHHFDDATLIKLSGVFGFCGLAIFSLSETISSVYSMRVFTSYLGLVISGAGLSVCSPIIISIAGKLPNIEPTQAIAIITTPMYLGYLVGPPLFGFLSYAFNGLNWALLFGACLILLIPMFAMFIKIKRGSSENDDEIGSVENDGVGGYVNMGSDKKMQTLSSS